MTKKEAEKQLRKVDAYLKDPDLKNQLSGKINGYGIVKNEDDWALKFFIPPLTWTASSIIEQFGLLPSVQIEIEEMGDISLEIPEKTDAKNSVGVGASVGNTHQDGGTLGCIVKKKDTGYFLSCNHVLALGNNAEVNDPIISPSYQDGGVYPQDVVGRLSESYFAINYEGINYYDAALAEITSDRVMQTNMLPNIGNVEGTELPKKHMKVAKFGKATGMTYGEIINTDYRMFVTINGKSVEFRKQFVIKGDQQTFATIGDSGAIIVNTETKMAVGLLSAVDSTGRYGIANRLEPILNIFKVSLM